jgi:hypothetical protein
MPERQLIYHVPKIQHLDLSLDELKISIADIPVCLYQELYLVLAYNSKNSDTAIGFHRGISRIS